MSERVNILLIAHSGIRPKNDPLYGMVPYDQWDLRIQKQSADAVKQYVDMILFANLEATFDKDSPKARKGRKVLSGDRLLFTQPLTGVEAKNRYDLQSPLEFSWAALSEGI